MPIVTRRRGFLDPAMYDEMHRKVPATGKSSRQAQQSERTRILRMAARFRVRRGTRRERSWREEGWRRASDASLELTRARRMSNPPPSASRPPPDGGEVGAIPALLDRKLAFVTFR